MLLANFPLLPSPGPPPSPSQPSAVATGTLGPVSVLKPLDSSEENSGEAGVNEMAEADNSVIGDDTQLPLDNPADSTSHISQLRAGLLWHHEEVQMARQLLSPEY